MKDEEILALAERFPLPVGVYDSDGRIVLLNRFFTELFGYSRDDLPDIDSWWRLAYPDPDYRQEVQSRWAEQARSTGGPLSARNLATTPARSRVEPSRRRCPIPASPRRGSTRSRSEVHWEKTRER